MHRKEPMYCNGSGAGDGPRKTECTAPSTRELIGWLWANNSLNAMYLHCYYEDKIRAAPPK